MKIGDKVYIIEKFYYRLNPLDPYSEYNVEYEFNIGEIKRIASNFLELNPIIGDIRGISFDDTLYSLDNSFIKIVFMWGTQYVTCNEQLAISKYKNLLEENGT